MFEPLFGPLFSSLFSSLIDAAQRIFITLNGTDAFYTIENPVVETGEFNHTYDVIVPAAGGHIVADNTPTTGVSRVAIGFDGALFIATDTSDPYFDVLLAEIVAIMGDGILHEIGMRRNASNVITISLDGVDIDSRAGAGTFTFNSIAAPKGATTGIPFWAGIIANPDLGNGNAWQLNRPFPTNTEQSSSGNNLLTYVNIDADARELFTFNQSDGRWNGVGIIVNGGFDTGANWSGVGLTIANGVANLDNVGGGGANVFMQQSVDRIDGANYEFMYDIISTLGTTLSLEQAVGMELFDSASVGVDKSFDFQWSRANNDLTINRFGGNTVNTDIDNIRLRRFIPIA